MQSSSWNEGLHGKLLKTPVSFWVPNNPHFNFWNKNLIAHLAVLKPSKAKNISTKSNDQSKILLHAITKETVLRRTADSEFNYSDRKASSNEAITIVSSDGDETAQRQFQCDFHFRIWFRLTVLGLGKYQEVVSHFDLGSWSMLHT